MSSLFSFPMTMTIINSILKPLQGVQNRPSPLRNPLRKLRLSVDDLLFDLRNGGVPDDYCLEQFSDIEERIKAAKELMFK